MAAIAFTHDDDSMQHLVLSHGRCPGSELGMVHFSDPPVNGHYLDSNKRVLTDDEFATVSAILIAAGMRALDVVGERTGGTA